jgi:two-component system, NtrC family, nitrogen regulation sensor histidine kinase NtrY
MSKTDAFLRRRVSLQVKLVAILMVVVLAPLAASAYFIDQVGKVAANFAASEAAARDRSVEKALDAHLEWVALTKQLHAEVAALVARVPAVAAADPAAPLDQLIADQPQLMSLRLRDREGRELAQAERALPPGSQPRIVVHPLAGGATLEVGFAIPDHLQRDYQELAEALDVARKVAQVRTALPSGYRTAFLALVGAAALAVVVLGVFAANRVTRRIAALVEVARVVSKGDTERRARLGGGDEMAELGVAFDTMLDDLGRQRREIEYLQRIGAWQDVARRLAHEIKNPLTPIQLAVQQCVSAYGGDDPRFKRLLADTGEIVEEEIAGLRRLVDTFRTLGQLPRVEAAAVPLADIVEDLGLDPALGERLVVRPPDSPVKLRADKLLLKRVLANLVENGVHAGQEAGKRGEVVVGWTVAGGARQATITVDDEGKGVTAEARERIFEPYVTTKATGTGLGLAIAKKIALEHGGTLEVSPTPAPSGGARFVLTVPLADA